MVDDVKKSQDPSAKNPTIILTETQLQNLERSIRNNKRYMSPVELNNLKAFLQAFDDTIITEKNSNIEITGGIITFNLLRYENGPTEKFKWQVKFSMNSDHKEIALSKVRILERWD